MTAWSLEQKRNKCDHRAMRLDPDRMLNLALITLAEHVETAADAPARPTAALRLALAVAFSFSKDGDRAPFDDFWRQALEDRKGWSEASESYRRSTYLMTKLRGVMRAVGIEPCVATELPLLKAARKALPARREGRFNPLTQQSGEE